MDVPGGRSSKVDMTAENFVEYMKDVEKRLEKEKNSTVPQLKNNENSGNSRHCQSAPEMALKVNSGNSKTRGSSGSSGPQTNPKSFPRPDPNFIPSVSWLIPKKSTLSKSEKCAVAKSLLKRMPMMKLEYRSSDEEEEDDKELESVGESVEETLDDNEINDIKDCHTPEEVFEMQLKEKCPAADLNPKFRLKPVEPVAVKENNPAKPRLDPQSRRPQWEGSVKPTAVRPSRPTNIPNQQKRQPLLPVRESKPPVKATVRPWKPTVPATQSDQLTITVNGKTYNLMRLLGSGGSSKVHLVCEPDSRDLFAVKCVDLSQADEDACRSFHNEIKLLQKLQGNERIVTLHDFEYSTAQKALYVVLEHGDTDLASYVNGILKRGEKLSHEMIRFYWSEMLKAVQVIHKAGIVHSDLKPANFLLVKGCLKLIDFGIASAIQPDVTSVVRNSVVGTFNFISPEALINAHEGPTPIQQHGVKKIGVKADVWSLGCILYSWVYGKTPFQHITNQAMKLHAITSDTHKITFPDLSDKMLLDVLKKCLVRDRRFRASTEDLLQHAYLASATVIGQTCTSQYYLNHLSNSLDLTPNRKQKLDAFVDSLQK